MVFDLAYSSSLLKKRAAWGGPYGGVGYTLSNPKSENPDLIERLTWTRTPGITVGGALKTKHPQPVILRIPAWVPYNDDWIAWL